MLLSAPAVDARGSAKAQTLDRAVKRQRPVSINFQYLDPQSGKAPTQIGVELFNGEIVTIDLERVEQRGANNYSWIGTVRGSEKSHAILTVVNGVMAGSITTFDGGTRTGATYDIQSSAGATQMLRQLDPAAFPPDHPPGSQLFHAPSQRKTIASSNLPDVTPKAATASADSGSTIDVLVVYSNQTASAAGTAIGAQIQSAVDAANTAYANSGVTTRLRLVHYEQVIYDESGDYNTDLNRLTNAGDGYMDNVPSLRNTYGADLVSLFVENPQYCGLAWVGPNASYAFSVVNRSCATGNLSFAHELAHNFGALHDPYVDPSTSPYAYGHGLTNPVGAWRTVMAYNDACVAAGTSCARIAYFSNANMTYGGAALGSTSTSDNTRVINNNAYTVANFRASASPGCTYTLSPASASVPAASSTSSFAVTAGAGCAWNAASNASWLTISTGSGTTDSGTLYYSVAANTGPARVGNITIGSQGFTVNQATGCTYALSPSSASVSASGGSANFSFATGAGCAWTVSSGASWLTVTSPGNGTGSATVSYSVATNSGSMRTGNLNVGAASFTVTEAAATAAPIATLSASTLNFGSQKVGTISFATSATLTNTGQGTLTIASMTAGGANPGDFVGAGTCGVNVALSAGQSCAIQYQFAPTQVGGRTATLSIATNAGATTLSLSGKGSKK
jgi:hypothetical protein